MPVLIDVGNTSITWGKASKTRLSASGSCLYDEIPKLVKKWGENGGLDNENILISSVVPKITAYLKGLFAAFPGAKVWVAGENLPVPLRHRYRFPKKLGMDRLVVLYGARKMFRPPLLVIDFGTAITFDYMSADGVFQGGMIVPGPELSFQALLQRAAMIPSSLRLPEKSAGFLGRTTEECIRSGTLEGYGAMTDELIRRFRSRFGRNLKVILTGGFSRHLAPYIRTPHVRDPRLSLKSLLLLAREKRIVSAQ